MERKLDIKKLFEIVGEQFVKVQILEEQAVADSVVINDLKKEIKLLSKKKKKR